MRLRERLLGMADTAYRDFQQSLLPGIDRIIGIRAGRIVYDGPSKQVDQAVLNAIYGDDAETEATA